MELTKKDIIQLLGVIKTNYAYAYKDIDKNGLSLLADLWFNSLKIYPINVITQVIQYTLEKSTYPPTLADIISNLKQLVYSTYPNANELWDEIAQAVSKTIGIYYFGEQYAIDGVRPKERMQIVYNNLNELCREWLGNASTLKEMRLLDTTALACEKARFYKDLPSIMERVFLQNRCNNGYISQVIEKLQITPAHPHTPKSTKEGLPSTEKGKNDEACW